MNFDFSAILVSLVALTGVIWGLDIVWWAPQRRAAARRLSEQAGSDVFSQEAVQGNIDEALREPHAVEYARSFFPVILIVLLLRSFLVEPFRIPSNSMMPTLLTGDFILVNKFAFGIRLPVLNTKVIDIGVPQRGDVVVFRFPKDPSIDYIKRVIGVPGDHVVYRNKVLHINGKRVEQVLLGPYTGIGSGIGMSGAAQLLERLDEVKHDILVDPRKNLGDYEITVPPGHYFAMGDNRDNSNDSRFWGTVPDKNLVGKAFLIWMNWDSANSGVAWNRIGSRIN